MDKRSFIIGITLILAGMGLMYFMQPAQQPAAPAPAQQPVAVQAPVAVPSVAIQGMPQPVDLAGEQTYTLRNEFLEVEFSDKGGAIKSARLLQSNYREYKDKEGIPYTFNAGEGTLMLGLSVGDAAGVHAFSGRFSVRKEESNARCIVFEADYRPGMKIVRRYRISDARDGAAPYGIEHSTELVNSTAAAIPTDKLYFNVGTARHMEADAQNYYLNFGWFDGKDDGFVGVGEFPASGGFFGWGAHPERPFIDARAEEGRRIVWGAVKNQFFTCVLSPHVATQADAWLARSIKSSGPDASKGLVASIAGELVYDSRNVEAGKTGAFHFLYYVGPKEYNRLSDIVSMDTFGGLKSDVSKPFGEGHNRVMEFGFFGSISVVMLWVLSLIHKGVAFLGLPGAWGWSIILVTCVVRLSLWPITAMSAKQAKRMQKLSEPLKQVREKYKDDPAAAQKAMMDLYRKHKVNPMAGCLPMLIQIPIFFGFFTMLKTASELRFQEFFWISDLSQPENLFNWGVNIPLLGQYFNLLPILMGVTMVFQMRSMPSSMDPAQAKIFKFMPYFFAAISYTFSSGLVLYWTISNCFSILQTWLTKRQVDKPEDVEIVEDESSRKRGRGKYAKPE